MDINIYDNYKVIYTCEGANIDEENSEPNDIVFKDFNYSNVDTLNGSQLIYRIASKMIDYECQRVIITKNTITIEHFNPNNGESCTYKWVIEEVK